MLALLICMLICCYRPEPSAATGTGSQWPLASSSRRIKPPSCGAVGKYLDCCSFLLIRFCRPWAVRGVCSQFGLDHLAGTRPMLFVSVAGCGWYKPVAKHGLVPCC